ncbi:MAG TPA: hypothetical protein VK961_23480 [Chthoniobacter sp.]|nr:hypothetical protein [Chthoniobacter sp.]
MEISVELGQHFHAVNDYTQAQWQQVTNERWASDERRNFEFRENLGGIQTYTNPYDNNPERSVTQSKDPVRKQAIAPRGPSTPCPDHLATGALRSG